MIEFKIKIDGLDSIIHDIEGIKKDSQVEIVKLLTRVGDRTAKTMEAEAPKATGKLSKSIKYKISIGSSVYRLEIFPDVGYAGWVESGRGNGGSPPITSLKKWAMAVGFPSKKIDALARSIAQGKNQSSGKPNKFVERTFDKLLESIDSTIDDYLKELKI